MTKKQKVKAVKKTLQYLIDEGFVVQEGDEYRLKTEEEIQEEINNP